MQKETIW